LHFKRANIDPAASYTIKPWAALVVERWRIKVRIAGINSRAAQ